MLDSFISDRTVLRSLTASFASYKDLEGTLPAMQQIIMGKPRTEAMKSRMGAEAELLNQGPPGPMSL